MTKKVLNLYAGIGGNRKGWTDFDVDVTAVEINEDIANIYQDYFPDDEVVVADAHEYLKEHYDDGWDFIWSSPPCKTHSKVRMMASKNGSYQVEYPDLELYEEILFLKHYFEGGKWVVENVNPFYETLIEPQKAGRHLFWSNFDILDFHKDGKSHNERGYVENEWFDLSDYDIEHRKDQIIRNTVNPKLSENIFKCAFKEKQERLIQND